MRREFAIAALARVMLTGAILAGSGCAQTQADPQSREADKRPTPREHGSLQTAPPAGSPPAEARPASPEELLNRMGADLAARLGVKPPDLEVRAVEPVVWNDSSLGCPQPGQMYAQAQTPGLRALFQYAGKTYQYHGSERGHFLLCANPQEPAGKFDER